MSKEMRQGFQMEKNENINFEYSLIKGGNHIYNYRCDEFTTQHNGMHVLFLGDSFTAGDGLEKEDVWSYKVYKKISETNKTSGYYNIAFSGSSFFSSVLQFFNYCYLYGNPKIVFFMITDIERDKRYFKDQYFEKSISGIYKMLEQYCFSNKIELYSFTWSTCFGQDKLEESSKIIFLKFNKFKTFYHLSCKDLNDNVYKNYKSIKKEKYLLQAKDKKHPGKLFHNFYASFIYDKYLTHEKDKNDYLWH